MEATPDLASVLRALAEFAPAPAGSQPHANDYHGYIQSGLEQGATLKSALWAMDSQQYIAAPTNGVSGQPKAIATTADPRPLPQSSRNIFERVTSSTPPIDPAVITEWSAGLRYVNKLAMQNSNFASSVQRMIADQHQHERLWWEGRQALIEKQSARVDGSRKLNDVLRSIGGSHIDEPITTTPEQNEVELRMYDMKAYRAQNDMAKAMSAELKALGVPFFGTKSDLVRQNDREAEDARPSSKPNTRITEDELLDLQRRMLTYLEDMYKP